MKAKLLLLFIAGFFFNALSAQDNPLPGYIDEALASNISLKQKELSYEKSLMVMKEARANFLPTLSFEARYSVARGGRTIEFPVGDLMNPVYNNLNLVNQFNRQALPEYPDLPVYEEIANEEINFLRSTEHDTKLRLVFPIYNDAILQNQKLRQNQSAAEKVSVEAYKKELRKEVKTAYYNYRKAYEAIQLYEEVLALVQENLRTTESLFRHHKITQDAVFGAETEVKAVEQQLAVSRQAEIMAKAYFNFLLNRDHDTEIELSTVSGNDQHLPSLEEARTSTQRQRETIRQFNHYLAISDNRIDLYKSNNRPNLSLVGDYGFQGTKYSFGRDDDYAMGSLVLSWSLFNQANKAKVQQALIDKNQLTAQKEEVQQQINLQVIQAWYEVQTAVQQVELTDKEIKSTQSAYRLVEKKFRQGQANLVELTNARTQYTNARQKKIIAQFDRQVKMVELDWATGN